MKWFVSVLGPYDLTYVGPFETEEKANVWKGNTELMSPQFDYCIVSGEALDANMAEFGPVAIETPNWTGN